MATTTIEHKIKKPKQSSPEAERSSPEAEDLDNIGKEIVVRILKSLNTALSLKNVPVDTINLGQKTVDNLNGYIHLFLAIKIIELDVLFVDEECNDERFNPFKKQIKSQINNSLCLIDTIHVTQRKINELTLRRYRKVRKPRETRESRKSTQNK